MMDALAKAREVAARLSGLAAPTGGAAPDAGDLGKRKSRGWGEDPSLSALGGVGVGGVGTIKKFKLYMPKTEGVNFLGLVIGPRGATAKRLSESTGAKLLVRGRGSTKDGAPINPEDDDDLHVLLEGTDEAIEKATKELMMLFNNPEEAMRLKGEQLRNLAQMTPFGVPAGAGGDQYGATLTYGPGSGAGVASASAEEGGLSFQLKMPNNMVGFVIGKGGENIQRMQAQTGGRIQIPKESEMKPGETHRTITLTGTPDAIADLRRKIDEIIAARLAQQSGGGGMGGGMGGMGGGAPQAPRAKPQDMDHAFILKVPVPNDKVGIIIGKGGSTIKSIQERSRAAVQIPAQPDEDNPAVRTISIGADTEEFVMAAQMEIHQALSAYVQQSMSGGGGGGGGHMGGSSAAIIYVHVPDDRVGGIIGKGGSTVKDIQARLRVKVTIPTTADPQIMPPTRVIQVSGSPEAVQVAKHEIETIVTGLITGQRNFAPNAGYPPQQQFHQQHAQQQSYYGGGGPSADPYGMYNYGQGAPQGAIPSAEAQNPAQYYNDYWTYAAHYGEKAARLYYGAWSPPEGTLPPPGVTVAPDIDLTAILANEGKAATSGESAAAVSDETQSADMIEYRKNYRVWWEEHGKAAGAPETPPEP